LRKTGRGKCVGGDSFQEREFGKITAWEENRLGAFSAGKLKLKIL